MKKASRKSLIVNLLIDGEVVAQVASLLGRKGGQVKSEAKAAAARENGKKPKRKRAAKLSVMLLAFGLLAGCSSSPLAPTAAATLEARAIALTCDAETCRFTGTAANTGNECARGVNGLLAIRNPDGSLFVQVSWNLPDEQVIRPTEQFTYSGQIPQRTYPNGATTQTFFYWRETPCR